MTLHMQRMGFASIAGAAALIRAVDAHQITSGEFMDAIEGLSSEGLQLISAVLDARAISRPDSPGLLRGSRVLCFARAASLRSPS
jgi:hypothetical protein